MADYKYGLSQKNQEMSSTHSNISAYKGETTNTVVIKFEELRSLGCEFWHQIWHPNKE